MKFILFNMFDGKKNEIKKIILDNNSYIYEVNLSKEKLLERLKRDNRKGVFNKIKKVFYDKSFIKLVIKALEVSKNKWGYIFSNNLNIDEIKFLENKIQSVLGYKIIVPSELTNNAIKYLDEFCNSKGLEKHSINALIVCSENKNLNIFFVKKLIKECKTINIYLKEKPSSYILKQIKLINKEEGSAIDIINKEKKNLKEYDFIYFIDDEIKNYPRLRLKKDALILDNLDARKDKYNSNYIYLTDYLQRDDINKEEVLMLKNRYDELELAATIRKVIN